MQVFEKWNNVMNDQGDWKGKTAYLVTQGKKVAKYLYCRK